LKHLFSKHLPEFHSMIEMKLQYLAAKKE